MSHGDGEYFHDTRGMRTATIARLLDGDHGVFGEPHQY